MSSKRYFALDEIRGLAVLNMIAYHLLWDLMYMFHVDMPWLASSVGYVWQQLICCTFITLSGFCSCLGSGRPKRGIIVVLLSFVVSAFTYIFTYDSRVCFGILTLIGSCMLLIIPFDRYIGKKISPSKGLILSLCIFFITKNVNDGWFGFEGLNLVQLPDSLYSNIFTAYLGFPHRNFFSTDYFSLLPWAFLFLTGYFLGRQLLDKPVMSHFTGRHCRPLEWIGRHALPIYVAHQAVIYGILTVIFSL